MLLAIFWQTFICSPSRASWDRWYSGSLAQPASCSDPVASLRTLRVAHLGLGILLLLAPLAHPVARPDGLAKQSPPIFLMGSGRTGRYWGTSAAASDYFERLDVELYRHSGVDVTSESLHGDFHGVVARYGRMSV